MHAVPNGRPDDPQSLAEPDHLLFPLLNEYWEAVRRDEAADPQQWLSQKGSDPLESRGQTPFGKGDTLRDLRVLGALNVARQTLSDDSCLESTDICGADPGDVPTRPLLEPGALL